MLFIAHRGVELRLETSCRDPILLSDEKVEGYIKSAVAMIEANKCYIAWWRTTDNPMNIECQLFVSHGPDGKVQETRAVYFCMDKANRRTQTHNTRDKLEPPFTQYCMLRTQNNGYLRLDIRRHRGGNDELFVGDLIDDGEPHAALQVKFKRPLGSSMGRQETAQSGGPPELGPPELEPPELGRMHSRRTGLTQSPKTSILMMLKW
ncbi:hypothetical protein MSAN_01258000 [Mycena sanguinolenta]|uniref:Uncharacterized protein n=1 Tax=Mycena sanguinolenta TaxID=230812 RepID=A0A8H6YDM0_9AGAR|nr:hypothetical protein MSAN_01258000 [Mycena sanguinolenta]